MTDELPPTTITTDVPATLNLTYKVDNEKRTIRATDDHLRKMGYIERDHVSRKHRQVLFALLGIGDHDDLSEAGQLLAHALNCTIDYDGDLSIAYSQGAIARAMAGGERQTDDPDRGEIIALRAVLVRNPR